MNQGFTVTSSETGNTLEEQDSVNEAFAVTYNKSKKKEPNAKDNVTMKRPTKKDKVIVECSVIEKENELIERNCRADDGEMFCDGNRMLYRFNDEFIYGPFSEDQITYVHDSLTEKFNIVIKKFSNLFRFNEYIWKVLAPTFLTKIVMENENVPQEEAETYGKVFC
ncbi:hypothetical protein Pcinc_022270 [Petrolisthes cinctipes]|uniref:Uncharacterized protein n=1 Tax=Petrolisthes cinctipes TaxID=88211 RepID=A0AAE1FI37_PETCI|nr:hypothetical protein Pcinc_022270 [Petrolisthes cinctipes]